MTQEQLERLKAAAEQAGRWAEYLLNETEYWTPMTLNTLTEDYLEAFQKRQAQWMMENERMYPDSGAAEVLRAEITEVVKMQKGCLTEDEAFEMERQRSEGMSIEELPLRLTMFRVEQEKERKEYAIESKLMNDYPLTKEEMDYIRQLPKEHLLQILLRIDEEGS